MKCPVCNLDQVIVEWEGVELDLCIDGHGVWFDADELWQLFSRTPEAGVDDVARFERRLLEWRVPRAAGGHGPRRRCPRCDRRMDHVAVPDGGRRDDAAVILDACPAGHGLWFDDGELERTLEATGLETVAGLPTVRGFLAGFGAAGVSDAGNSDAGADAEPREPTDPSSGRSSGPSSDSPSGPPPDPTD